MSRKKIVILGGGFAGVYTAAALEKRLRPEEASIALVNAENYFVYKPLLPEVVSGSVGLTDVVAPIGRLCPRTKLVLRDADAIDPDRRVVSVARGFEARHLELSYDHLVIALGQKTDFSLIPGLVEHGLPFRDLSDAISVRNRVIRCLAEAEVEQDPAAKKALLTFVVAGGGFSGVEVVAMINDLVRGAIRSYSKMFPEAARVVLVQSGDRILPEVSASLAEFAKHRLRKQGVEVRLNDRLLSVSSRKATFRSGTEVPTRCVVSTVPSTVPDVLAELHCEKERSRLVTTSHLELAGFEGSIWALGDCARITLPNGNHVPQTAQHATREAECVAHNVAATIRGGGQKAFDFGGLGKMGSLGHHSAVAEVMGVRISGFAAWVLWRFFYLMHMPGWDHKLRIGLAWFMKLFVPPDLVQLRMGSAPGVHRQHLEPGENAFEEGDVGDSVYVIIDGECEVFRDAGDEKKHLSTLGPGDVFGEMALLRDASRNATVRAVRPSNLLVISKPVFDALSSSLPDFKAAFGQIAAARTQSDPADDSR